MGNGIYYIATDDRSKRQARVSAERVRELTDYPVAVASGDDPEEEWADIHIEARDVINDWDDKSALMHLSPFDKTVFLDADTWLVTPSGVHDLLALLNGRELAFAHDTHLTMDYVETADLPEQPIPESFPMLNTGVLAFDKTESVIGLFEQWASLQRSARQQFDRVNDQYTFRRALWESDVDYTVVPPEYNFRLPYPRSPSGEIKMLHGHASNFPEIAKRLNASAGPRGYHPIFPFTESNEQPFVASMNPAGRARALRRFLLRARCIGLFPATCMSAFEPFIGTIRAERVGRSLKRRGVGQTAQSLWEWRKTGNFGLDD